MPVVKQVCRAIEDLTGMDGELHEQLEAAVRHARIWLVEQNEERRKLFDNLNRAVDEHKPGRVRRLLMRVNATASEDRTDAEPAVYERATTYFESLDDLTRDAVEAEADTEKEVQRAAARVRSALQRLRGYDAYTPDLRHQVEELLRSAASAGELLTRGEARRVEVWKKRAALGPREQLRVARRYWIQQSCPRCNAQQGKDCVLVEGPSSGKLRKDGHNERLQLVLDERKAAQKMARQQKKARQEVEDPAEPVRPALEARGYRMTCPRCHAGPGKLCDNDDRVGPSEKRQLPHDERLRRVLQSDDRIGPGEQQKVARNERQQQAVDVVPPPPTGPNPGLLGRAGEGGNRRKPRARRRGPGMRRRSPARSARPARTPRVCPTVRTTSGWSGRRSSPANCGAEAPATASPGQRGAMPFPVETVH
ncbi:hypothetical protein [Streptomyces sp. NPDC006510]|uniref:zinc finger domain-containing protein n=1 Tax=Streptomyces sp. NPDC006510 TaxID=3155600 RepID=UPI0033B00837